MVENEHNLRIEVELKQRPTSCPLCYSESIVGFGRRNTRVKDMPRQGKMVDLYIHRRRMLCSSCKKTFSEPLPDVDEHRFMTTRVMKWICSQCLKRTFSSIAKEIGVAEGTVRALFKDCVTGLDLSFQYTTPNWIGIDEIHLTQPRGVITNLQNNTLFALLNNCNKGTITRFFSNLKDKAQIQYVAMGLWPAYRDGCTIALPNAKIGIDKHHVVKLVNDALEKVR
ncbi:MAG: transposase, partial [Candidatus Nanopelagicales bacterium]